MLTRLTRVVLLSLCAIFLVACASSAPEVAPSPTTAASSAAAENTAETAAFPVTIAHDQGDLTLEQPATRVVVFSEEFMELAIALEIAPVGFGVWRDDLSGEPTYKLPYLEDKTIAGEPVYFEGGEPNLETVLALKPDLILFHEINGEANIDVYNSLAAIAPTLSYLGGEVGGWQRAIRGLGQATGRSEQAEKVIADYEVRVAELQNELKPIVTQAPEVSVLLSWVDGAGIFDERFPIGYLVSVLGFDLTVPAAAEMDEDGFSLMSAELLGAISADTILVLRLDTNPEHIGDPLLATVEIPVLQLQMPQGMGYTGPYTEIMFLEMFVEAFKGQYATE